ncbi:MAG: hypothetical protein KC777_21070 [Cyanobacteria bacterium HKST-UBA02]|nr:hypothetical protein [Cyanobacteria bacterium HKST-UBA02]
MGRRFWFIPRVDESQPENPLAGFSNRLVSSRHRLLHEARSVAGRIERSYCWTEKLAQPGRHEGSELSTESKLTLGELGRCQSNSIHRYSPTTQKRKGPNHLPESTVTELHPTRTGLFEIDFGRSEFEGAIAAVGGKPYLARFPDAGSDAKFASDVGSMLDQPPTEGTSLDDSQLL